MRELYGCAKLDEIIRLTVARYPYDSNAAQFSRFIQMSTTLLHSLRVEYVGTKCPDFLWATRGYCDITGWDFGRETLESSGSPMQQLLDYWTITILPTEHIR